MDLSENIADMEERLKKYEETHPNLICLWRTKLMKQINNIHMTTEKFKRATKLFKTNPDPSIETLAILMCLLHSKKYIKEKY